jgi:transcriptional regulator with XRE-family HTH domain
MSLPALSTDLVALQGIDDAVVDWPRFGMDTSSGAAFGQLLQQARKRRGLSQRSVARQAGLDSTYVSRLERGVVPPPKVPTVHRLARALQLDPGEEIELIHASGRLPPNVAAVARIRKESENDEPPRELLEAYSAVVMQVLKGLYGDIVVPGKDACTVDLHFALHPAALAVVPGYGQIRLVLTVPLPVSIEDDPDLALYLLQRNAALPVGAYALDAVGRVTFQDSIPASICSQQDLAAWTEVVLDTADRFAGDISSGRK